MNRKLILYTILASAVIITSCNNSQNDVFKVVPDDAAAVASFSPGKLLDKADAADFEYMKDLLDNKEFNKILFENPAMSGIRVNANSCIFLLNENGKYLAVAVPLKSKKLFEVFLDKLGDEYGSEFKKETGNGYTFSQNGNHILAWNKTVAIHLTRMDGSDFSGFEEILNGLFSLPDEKCVLSEKDFKSFLNNQKDLNVWLTSNQLSKLNIPALNMMNILGAVNNNYMHFFLEFQNGAAVVSTNLLLNPDFKKNFDKFNIIDQNAQELVLKMLPSENLVAAGNFRLNPEKITEILNSTGSGNSAFPEGLLEQTGRSAEEIIKSLQGSIAFTINGIQSTPAKTDENGDSLYCSRNLPLIAIALQLNDEQFFKDFLNIISQKNKIIEKSGYFEVRDDNLSVFMGVKNKIMLISNDEKNVSEIISTGEIKSNLLSTDVSKYLINNPICFYMNLDRDTYPVKMNDYLNKGSNHGYAGKLKNFSSAYKSITLSGNLEKSELRVEMKDKSVNSLHAILQSFDHKHPE